MFSWRTIVSDKFCFFLSLILCCYIHEWLKTGGKENLISVCTWLNVHKAWLSWWEIGSLSWCFTPHLLRGLFVLCFSAWQLWHGFLPSWPCSLKCNKSWIPMPCCTSIRVLVAADKSSPVPWEKRKNEQATAAAVQSVSAEVKYICLKPAAPRVVS